MIRNEEWVVNFSFFGGLDGTLGEGIGTPWLVIVCSAKWDGT